MCQALPAYRLDDSISRRMNGPSGIPTPGPAPVLLRVRLPVVSRTQAPTCLSILICFHLLLGSLVFLPESKHQPWIKTCYKMIQPSNTQAKNYLQHLFWSQLNKAHHAFEREKKTKIVTISQVRVNSRVLSYEEEERKLHTHHRPLGQKLGNKSDPLAWAVNPRSACCQGNIRLPIKLAVCEEGGQPLPSQSRHWHLGAAFSLHSLWQRKSPIKSLQDLGSEDTCL